MPQSQCDSPYHIAVSSRKQYLSSDVTGRLGCGSEAAPWVLSAEEGQQINMTLIDFYWDDGGAECSVEYGYIIDGGRPDTVTFCGGQTRTRHLTISTGDVVQIVIKEDLLEKFRFLVEFHGKICAFSE